VCVERHSNIWSVSYSAASRLFHEQDSGNERLVELIGATALRRNRVVTPINASRIGIKHQAVALLGHLLRLSGESRRPDSTPLPQSPATLQPMAPVLPLTRIVICESLLWGRFKPSIVASTIAARLHLHRLFTTERVPLSDQHVCKAVGRPLRINYTEQCRVTLRRLSNTVQNTFGLDLILGGNLNPKLA